MTARKFYDTDGNEIVGDPSKDDASYNPPKRRLEDRTCTDDSDSAGSGEAPHTPSGAG